MVFSGHRRLGGDVGRWLWSTEEQRATQGYFPHSCLPATQAVCRSSGLKLPREKAKRPQPQREHNKRHGCGESVSPAATSLAEDLARHRKSPGPTPTSSPCWPQETQALSKLSFPEQSPCFPNLAGKGTRAQLLPVSTWLVTDHNCPLCFLWLGRGWYLCQAWDTETLNMHV